jgi:hypothetical protein
LFAAGSAVVAAGEGLNAAMTVLTAGFGANTGLDIAGEVFGLSYQSSAESLLKLATAAVNACQQNGALIQQCAANYSIAEAASTLGGGASVLHGPAAPAKIGAPGPPGTLGPGEPPPLLWAIVQSFVDDVWPNGDVAALHAAAGCWRTFASAAGGMQGALNGPKTLIGTLQMPEGGKVIDVLSRMGDAIGKLGEQSGEMAKAVDGFANQVSHAQNNIRDLLHRLESLTDIWHDVVSIFDGDAFEEIKKIARDINEVLHDLGRQARAFEQGIKVLMQVADGLVVDVEKYMRGEFKHFMGDAVGNVVATDFDIVVNTNEGLVKGGIQTLQGLADLAPEWFLLDPKGAMATWKGTVEGQFKASLLNEILHPQEGGQANLRMWKSLLHLDDWSTARPGLGLGENAADALTLLIPGAGEAGAAADAGAAAARGAGEASEMAEGAGAAGRVGELAATSGALGDIGKVGTNLTKDLDNLKLDLPKADVPVGGRPVGAPPVDAPAGPAPRPVESAPPGTPQPHSPTAPSGPAPGRPVSPVGPHEPASVPAGGGPHEPASVPSEHLPSHTPQLAEPAPARVPVSPEGAPIESAPGAAQAAQQAPAMASAAPHAPTPHSTAPSASPTESPSPGGGGWHGPGDGAAPGGSPHDAPPTRDGPHGPGDDGPPSGAPGPSPDSGSPTGRHEPGDSAPTDERNPDHNDGSGDESHEGNIEPHALPAPELVSPPPDGAFFWSGRTADGVGIGPTSAGGNGAADLMADSHGGITLEGLLDRNGVMPPKWSFDDPGAQEWWSQVSGTYAENVQGEVRAVIGPNLRPGSVWETVELPRLMENPNVTKIVIIDPETGSETTIFER